jgi:hypothetical protein
MAPPAVCRDLHRDLVMITGRDQQSQFPLFALFFKGLSSLAAFLLLCALQALPVNVKNRLMIFVLLFSRN